MAAEELASWICLSGRLEWREREIEREGWSESKVEGPRASVLFSQRHWGDKKGGAVLGRAFSPTRPQQEMEHGPHLPRSSESDAPTPQLWRTRGYQPEAIDPDSPACSCVPWTLLCSPRTEIDAPRRQHDRCADGDGNSQHADLHARRRIALCCCCCCAALSQSALRWRLQHSRIVFRAWSSDPQSTCPTPIRVRPRLRRHHRLAIVVEPAVACCPSRPSDLSACVANRSAAVQVAHHRRINSQAWFMWGTCVSRLSHG